MFHSPRYHWDLFYSINIFHSLQTVTEIEFINRSSPRTRRIKLLAYSKKWLIKLHKDNNYDFPRSISETPFSRIYPHLLSQCAIITELFYPHPAKPQKQVSSPGIVKTQVDTKPCNTTITTTVYFSSSPIIISYHPKACARRKQNVLRPLLVFFLPRKYVKLF